MNLTATEGPTTVRRVCAIVVTFQPDLPVTLELLAQLDRSGCDFIVIDNASSNIRALDRGIQLLRHCRAFIAQKTNIGQAAALNLALDKAASEGYELALLFDQDSSIEPDFVAGMLTAWEAAQQLAPSRVAAIGPRLVEPRSGRRMPFRTFRGLVEWRETRADSAGQLVETAFLITSGTLLSLPALSSIGPMREEYFIDNVDLEWCFRATSRGYVLFGTEHARLLHRIGEDSDNPLVRRGIIVQHSALRYYYSTRNRLHLHRQPYTPQTWRVKDCARFILKSAYLLATSPQRRAFWSSLWRAVRDARQLS